MSGIEEASDEVACMIRDLMVMARDCGLLAHGPDSVLKGSPRLRYGRACLGQAEEKVKQAILLLQEAQEFFDRELNAMEPKEEAVTEKVPTRQGWSRE